MKNKVPKLRFPEFSGEWEEKSFGEIYSFRSTNSLSRDKLNYEQGKVKNIHYGDIHTKFKTLFDITNEKTPFINDEVSLEKIPEDNYCKNRDLIIADASEDYSDIGKSIEIINTNNQKILAGLHTFLARPDLYEIALGFGGYIMKSPTMHLQIKTIAQGTKVLSLSSKRVAELKFFIPCLPEQEKIANFLFSVDIKIEKLEKKKELLEKYKKGMMQKLFSQKLRFKDENGNYYPEWEEKRIGDLTKFHQQGYYTKDSYNLNNPYYLLSGANIKKHKIDLANCPKINASAKDFETFKVKKGDILLIRSGNVGDYAIAYEEKNIIFGSYLIKFNLNSQIIINEFFGYFYQSESKERQLKMIIQSSANVNINAENIKSLKITLPTLLEQEKIANFLSSIDRKIELIERELEKNKEFKKGLLQQMFV
ncbi:MAG: restriction endonuclease subunit S [Cetobacterium sp.]|uniref:restriction endonuclease subunit S n=1 Tax=Cetobacterium sp. TaxID=2071632 RepID=UPI002FCC98B1